MDSLHPDCGAVGLIHGLSQLSTVGALGYHSADFYFNLASKVMDVVLQGMVNVLELKKPE